MYPQELVRKKKAPWGHKNILTILTSNFEFENVFFYSETITF